MINTSKTLWSIKENYIVGDSKAVESLFNVNLAMNLQSLKSLQEGKNII